jgi:signal transduction histidine kinase
MYPKGRVSYLLNVCSIRSVIGEIQGPKAVVGDIVLAAAILVMVLIDLSSTATDPGVRRTDFWAYSLSFAQVAPLAFRRRAPLLTFFIIIAAVCTYYPLGYEVTDGTLATFIGVYTVAAYEDRPKSLIALGLLAFGMTWYWVTRVEPFDPTTPIWIGLLGVLSWGLGEHVRTRQKYTAEVEALAERLQYARELEARQAVWQERARLARELHDVIGHTVNVMVIQAGAGRRTLGSNPEAAQKAMETIESTGREALDELDRLLGILRREGDEADLPPQPGLEHLKTLAGRFEGSGLPVEITIEGDELALPRSLDASAYRIIQEALTNTLRHSEHATAHVSVRYQKDRVELEVVDDGRQNGGPAEHHGGGRGLIGIRERVAVFGGDLDAGPRPEGGFLVRCRLPLTTNRS